MCGCHHFFSLRGQYIIWTTLGGSLGAFWGGFLGGFQEGSLGCFLWGFLGLIEDFLGASWGLSGDFMEPS